MTVDQLKTALAALGQPVSGTKPELGYGASKTYGRVIQVRAGYPVESVTSA